METASASTFFAPRDPEKKKKAICKQFPRFGPSDDEMNISLGLAKQCEKGQGSHALPADCTRPPDHRKETKTAVVWSCLPFIRSGQNHLARHSERGEKARQTEKEVGRQHQGMDKPEIHQAPENTI